MTNPPTHISRSDLLVALESLGLRGDAENIRMMTIHYDHILVQRALRNAEGNHYVTDDGELATEWKYIKIVDLRQDGTWPCPNLDCDYSGQTPAEVLAHRDSGTCPIGEVAK